MIMEACSLSRRSAVYDPEELSWEIFLPHPCQMLSKISLLQAFCEARDGRETVGRDGKLMLAVLGGDLHPNLRPVSILFIKEGLKVLPQRRLRFLGLHYSAFALVWAIALPYEFIVSVVDNTC
jgi:hypothetical protein